MEKEYKLNWRYWFFLILFSGVVILGASVVPNLFAGEITDENGEPLGPAFSIIIGTLMTLVLCTYLITVFTLLRQLVVRRGRGLKITDTGIEDTMVFVNVFALVFVLPVRCIPWEAIKYYDKTDKGLYVRVNTKQVQAGFLARIILKILGYQFCQGFVKPDVTAEDIARYEHRFSLG